MLSLLPSPIWKTGFSKQIFQTGAYLATQQNLFRVFGFFVWVQTPELQVIEGHVWAVETQMRKQEHLKKAQKSYLFKLTAPLKGRAPPLESINISILEIFSSFASCERCKSQSKRCQGNHLLVEDFNLNFEFDILPKQIFILTKGKLGGKCKCVLALELSILDIWHINH